MSDAPYTVQHNREKSRFEVSLDGHLAKAVYELEPGVMRMTHTVVDPALEGKGIAGALVKAALAHARDNGLKIDPQCPYVRAYMERHPETHDLRI
jgi:predicted GNAT family acetyltransferase